jgi:hypothetical protein
MPTTTPSSPLRRVVSIITRLGLPREDASASPTALMFGSAFGYDKSNERDVVRTTVRLLALVEEQLPAIHDELGSIPNLDESDWGFAFDAVRKAFRYEYAWTNFSKFVNNLDERAVGMLKACAKLSPSSEPLISDDELQSIRDALQDLSETVFALPKGQILRLVLGEQIRQIALALLEYPFAGADALRVGLYQLDGSLLNQFGKGMPDDAAEETKAVVTSAQRLRTTLHRILAAVALAGAAMRASQEIGQIAAENVVYYSTGVLPPANDVGAK